MNREQQIHQIRLLHQRLSNNVDRLLFGVTDDRISAAFYIARLVNQLEALEAASILDLWEKHIALAEKVRSTYTRNVRLMNHLKSYVDASYRKDYTPGKEVAELQAIVAELKKQTAVLLDLKISMNYYLKSALLNAQELQVKRMHTSVKSKLDSVVQTLEAFDLDTLEVL